MARTVHNIGRRSRLAIPGFSEAPRAVCVHFGHLVYAVVHTGSAGGMEFHAGDLLVLGGEPRDRDLVLLSPRGHGRPMLGRVTSRGLVAEPGGIPCDPARWQVAGRILARVREDNRGGHVLPMSVVGTSGPPRHLELRFDPRHAMQVASLLAQRLPGLELTGPDSACVNGAGLLANAPLEVVSALVGELRERHGILVRAAVAEHDEQALAIVDLLPMGAVAAVRPGVRFLELAERQPQPSPAEDEAPAQRQMGLFA